MWSTGWRRIQETYLRPLRLEDAKHYHQQISLVDKLGRGIWEAQVERPGEAIGPA